MKNLRPINDCIVIKTLKTSHNVNGIELDSKANGIRYNFGEVVAASPNTVLEEGEQVYYDSAHGNVLMHEGKKYLILRERDISIIAGSVNEEE